MSCFIWSLNTGLTVYPKFKTLGEQESLYLISSESLKDPFFLNEVHQMSRFARKSVFGLKLTRSDTNQKIFSVGGGGVQFQTKVGPASDMGGSESWSPLWSRSAALLPHS